LATYFDANTSGLEYYNRFKDDEQFKSFYKLWEKQNVVLIQQANNKDSFFNKLKSNIEFYHQVCAEAEEGSQKKMLALLQCKKIFCIPWLLASDTLLTNYPDKYDSEEFKQQI
jgi:hypothetical protein